MNDEKLTPQRQRLIVNAMMDLLYLVAKNQTPVAPQQATRIRDGWDAIKPAGMQSVDFSQRAVDRTPKLILPFSETTRLPTMSEVDRYSAMAQLKDLRT